MRAITTKHTYTRLIAFALAAMVALVGLFMMTRSVFAESASGKNGRIITVYDNGQTIGFVTKAETVGEALADGGVRIDAKDRTEPSLDEKLVSNSYQVNIYRARPVLIRDGGVETRIITAFRTGPQIAGDAGIKLQDEDIAKLSPSTDPIADGAVEVMTIARATEFTFEFYGKTESSYTQAKTIGDMLKSKGIKMGVNDRIRPSESTAIATGMVVALWREGEQVVTVEEDVKFETEQIRDVNRERGYKEIKTPGETGQRAVTYKIHVVNGIEVKREELNSVTIKQPVKQVEVIGAKGVYTTPGENQRIAWDYLISKGFTREQAAGIMGNLMQEHRFNTSDVAGGLGLAQWTGSRRTKLLSMNDPFSVYTQLDFLWMELSGGYSRTLVNIQSSSTVEESVRYFQNGYERCGICNEPVRIKYAYDILASH